jgi:hypothetical protein
MVGFSPENDAKIIEAQDGPLDLMARGQFDHHMFTVSPDTIEKLILDIDLIFDHAVPSPSQKDLIS